MLAAWKQATREAETGQPLVFVLVLLLAGYAAGQRWVGTAGWLLDILINGYPVMLQRYNRARIEMVLQRHAERSRARFPAHNSLPDRRALRHSEIGARRMDARHPCIQPPYLSTKEAGGSGVCRMGRTGSPAPGTFWYHGDRDFDVPANG